MKKRVLSVLLSALTLGQANVAHAEQEAQINPWWPKPVAVALAAAKQGNVEAQFAIAVRYDDGVGVEQDDAQALYWYQQAANQGEPVAQYNVGIFYSVGRAVAQDPAQAVLWYQKAAQQNFALAQYNLGSAYENGLGVAQ
ncbi:MAG: tetratricopeptide repeat protein, partial [Plesiomonas shigelloides]